MTKTNIHKWVAILVSFLMIGTLFSMLPITNLTASAISCQKDGFDKSRYTLSGNMAEDVATIAKSQKGRTGAQFGYTEAWCDEFVADCIENAGADSSIVGHGGTVADFESIMRQKKGAVEVSSPQVGDLVFFTYSHVEIVTKVENGTVYCAGGNNGGTGNYKTNYCAGERKLYATARLYLRPNYKNINPKKWYENYECPDLGTDFYAYIINTQAWKMLTNESDNNIDIQSEIAQANQVWKFTRKDDGSYKIINCATSRALDSQGTSESGANVYTYEDSNNDPQSWYIYGESGAYYLRSKCTDCTMDVSGGSTEDGANVQMYTYNGSSAQKFQIWKLNSPSSVHVHGAAGSSYIPTTIWWTESANCTAYNIRIWNGKIWEGEPYKTIWNITDTSYEIFLPAGYYEIYIDAINYFTYTMSENVLSLTVSDGESVDIGTNIYAYIINYKPWLSLVDQQGNVTVQKQSAKNALWCFERQNDGSYLIQNIATKKYLDYDDKNIITSDNNGNESQKWYIYGRWSGEYFIKPKNADTILTVAGDTCTYENPTILSDLTWSENQKFSIYSFEGEELQRLLDTLYAPGDLNQDGTLSLTDLIPLQQSLLRQTTLTADEAQLADYNGDGSINVLDLMLLKRALLAL
ncbi:MAG: RICIN domain-containing protein [Ruminococcus sp.]|jgi:hypothetical protein|nr:RICIN domain-containing protein [Ruminococcus sp.]